MKNGNNLNFDGLDATGNPNITCVEVDDAAYSNATSDWNIDPTAVFSEDCAALAGIESIENNYFSIYPNPTENVLNIKLQEAANFNIVNLLGASVVSYSGLTGINTIDVNHLPNGMYFVESADFAKVRFIKKYNQFT